MQADSPRPDDAPTAHPGDVTSVIDPEGNETEFVFDPDTGYLVSVTDPLGSVTTFGYDSLGRQVSVVGPNGNVREPIRTTGGRRPPTTRGVSLWWSPTRRAPRPATPMTPMAIWWG